MTKKELNLPSFYLCSTWNEFFAEMQNCLQNGINITHDNYKDYLPEFERIYDSWIDSFKDY